MKEQPISSNNMKSFFEIWTARGPQVPFLGFVGHSNNDAILVMLREGIFDTQCDRCLVINSFNEVGIVRPPKHILLGSACGPVC